MNIMAKYTEIRPVVMKDAPDARNVFLVVDGQQFSVTPWGCETMDEAELIREQALAYWGFHEPQR